MNTITNRRSWLKQSALAAGGVMTGIAMVPDLFAKPAFGMTPVYNNLLFENYHVMMQDRENMKARLLANENPWGPSKKAVAAIAESAAKGNRYVYSSSKKMVDALVEKEGVTAEHILLSAGSTDILEKTAFALCMKGGNVISADPSYLSLVKTAQAIGATWKNIPLRSDYAHDLDAMEKAIDADTKLIYICNPNNPTGTPTPIESIKTFCKKVSSKVPVFIDEAYLELMENPGNQSATSLISEGYDVIVCRTFSKIHGMAGLRIGYMVAKPDRVKAIQKLVRTEMGISVTSLEGAMASLKDTEFQEYTRQHNKEGRDYVFAELKKAGMNPIPSQTNFILFPIQMPVKDLLGKMLEKGVGIRGYEIAGKPYGRVSMGTMDELKLFVKSMNSILS
ncbi:histidinol-phosphate aminotransferase family protein [Fulvivirgaceae bacterium PWU4]|uniref:Histidinol-phosphate aminotransferase family protein n=1 Tax=Chryseosolibacter histidini TaxID=2782349 RepID=A0AAP2DTE1_9BACT|nr:histidinol-phosphate transaminase [Chryseosolibacter histidini]MBT1700993.1 histidinol-phosphate aminotransferase family protein [Chryseosolibacter histidini]